MAVFVWMLQKNVNRLLASFGPTRIEVSQSFALQWMLLAIVSICVLSLVKKMRGETPTLWFVSACLAMMGINYTVCLLAE